MEQLYTHPCVFVRLPVCLSVCLMSVPRFVCPPKMHIAPQLNLDIHACFFSFEDKLHEGSAVKIDTFSSYIKLTSFEVQ